MFIGLKIPLGKNMNMEMGGGRGGIPKGKQKKTGRRKGKDKKGVKE